MTAKHKDRVIDAASQVFLRYGYKRVTMGDIAEAAKMSRPAVYLVFPSKEEILAAVVSRVFTQQLEEMRQGIEKLKSPEEKLRLAFEIWAVRNYELVNQSPDAKDLYESSFEFAADVTKKVVAEFVLLVAEILEPLRHKQDRTLPTSLEIARVLTNAVPGFKAAAENVGQMRESVAVLITVVLASLGAKLSHSSFDTL